MTRALLLAGPLAYCPLGLALGFTEMYKAEAQRSRLRCCNSGAMSMLYGVRPNRTNTRYIYQYILSLEVELSSKKKQL